ncbi:hypothetical protein [Streptomyces sp. NPDC093991]|uniref:hypothetical protein n=1 Tax=unclassified Streptomyces TaxID=2593676 RepID=UPI00342CCF54
MVPLHRDIWAGGLAVLDVGDSGKAAHGRFAGEAWFMPARGERLPGAAVDAATGRSSTTALSAALLAGPGFGVFAYARLPHITVVRAAEDGGCGCG